MKGPHGRLGDVMADDPYARIAQLKAELRQLRERHAEAQTEVISLHAELESCHADLQVSNRQLTEALEQQAAMAAIMRVIATTPTDAQPAIEAIVETAARLSESVITTLNVREGEL